jgi:predicted ATPase
MWSKGHSAEETKAAFAQAVRLAAGAHNAPEGFAAYYGQWMGSVGRGELGVARAIAETLLREAEAEGRPTEIGVGRRALGQTCSWLGNLSEARRHLEKTIGDYDPERDREARVRFGLDTRAVATSFLATTTWLMGEVEHARQLIDEAICRAAEISHIPTVALVNTAKLALHVFSRDAAAVARASKAMLAFAEQHGLPLYRSTGEIASSWAAGRLEDPEIAIKQLRESLAAYVSCGGVLNVPLFHGLLAEIEAGANSLDGALLLLDEGISLARRTGEHVTDALLYRVRGDILLKRDPINFGLAAEAFRTAIAIAQEQKGRSLELQAALPLAQLYHSNARPADAYAVLAPALEGFSPTPEMPEIAEAQALLEQLALAAEPSRGKPTGTELR